MSLARLRVAWIALQSSLWFVPALIVTAAVVLAVALIELDARVSDELLARFPRLFGAGASGTRGMLTAIATSEITVAGVVFSITIVVLSLTASQYTSRVLRNFMRDRTNQVVLGAFLGIYAYCLVVLRTIRGDGELSFVPSIATLGAVVLAFIGLAVLIHFIHHVSAAIQVAHILKSIREDTARAIEHLFPDELGAGEDDASSGDEIPTMEYGDVVRCEGVGYVQSIDGEALIRCACEESVVFRLAHRIGDFAIPGVTLAQSSAALSEEGRAAVRRAILIGDQRTIEQDASFGIRQIVDIALKALSPGINDPTTAAMCLDQLGALLASLARRRFPSPLRSTDGQLRVIAPVPSFASITGQALDEIRAAAAAQPVVLARLVKVVGMAAGATDVPSRREALLAQLAPIERTVSRVEDPVLRDALARELVEAARALQSPTPIPISAER